MVVLSRNWLSSITQQNSYTLDFARAVINFELMRSQPFSFKMMFFREVIGGSNFVRILKKYES